MKAIKIFLCLTLPMTLILLIGCERVRMDGTVEQISWYTKAYDVIFGIPPRKKMQKLERMKLTGDPTIDKSINLFNKKLDEQNAIIEKNNAGAKSDRDSPDNGLLPIIGLISTLGGCGWIRTYLKQVKITIEAAAGEQNKLFGSVTADEIRRALADKGYQLDKKRIQIGESLRTLGTHSVTVEIYPQVKTTVTVEIVRKS